MGKAQTTGGRCKPVRVYISGPMSGYPQHNYPAFLRAEIKLRAGGVSVVNPATLNPSTRAWWRCMVVDVWHLLGCDEITLLHGWQTSTGARIELLVALLLGMRVSLHANE